MNLLTTSAVNAIAIQLERDGYAEDIEWSEAAGPPTDADDFASEAIYVVCNSGMRFTVARGIFERCMGALQRGDSASTAFGHKGKAAAIDRIWRDRQPIFDGFMAAEDKVAFCVTLPFIGNITKFHLAKNFGAQVAKPDVHLQRLADLHGETPQGLCERLAAGSGYKVATIDLLLWRACATGVIDSRTGALTCPS